MATAAKSLVRIETVKDAAPPAAAKAVESLKRTADNYSPREEAQRRKWGVETRAVRSIHARKF